MVVIIAIDEPEIWLALTKVGEEVAADVAWTTRRRTMRGVTRENMLGLRVWRAEGRSELNEVIDKRANDEGGLSLNEFWLRTHARVGE
jgi:Ser-tRNA(Ala) deacylase AlaX